MSESRIQVIENRAVCPARHTADEKPVRRVAAYCRVSTLLEEQEESYETQCAYYKRLTDMDSALALVDVYGDHGVSGRSAKERPEFQRMMKDCTDGKVDLVMTKSVSRFARNLADCVECVRQLREKGIPVLFEREGLNSMDSGCEMLLSLLAALAQEELNSLSQNIRWALEHRNANGDPARMARYGYRKAPKESGKRREWRIYEPEVRRVKKAFQMAAKGRNYQEIIAVLNAMEDSEEKESLWTLPRVREMLLSEVYIGDILTNKQYSPDYLSKRPAKNTGQRPQYYIEGHHPPIIDRELFQQVGELVRSGALRAPKCKGRAIA